MTVDTHDGLISFLGYMQHIGVDLLRIRWQSALRDVDKGGSAPYSTWKTLEY